MPSAAGDGEQTVSFTVGVESAATKAVADGDGAAANINHWVMQVLDSDDEVYNYQEKDGQAGVKTQTFDVPLIKGQTYQVLFWADTKGSYVVTDLRDVKRATATELKANADSLDAFSAVVKDFTTTVATQKTITLKRPFAQLNVVFTDLKKLYETMNNADEYAKFIPTDFVAKAKVPTTFNVLTQEAGAPASTALEMKAANCYNPSGVDGQDNYTTHAEKATLYMDYVLTSKDSKDVVDIDFSFVSKGVTIAHNFAAVPFQRNYRTHIIGELMSAGAHWTVEVKPDWDTPEYDIPYYEATSIEKAQEYIDNEDNQKSKDVNLKDAEIKPTDVNTDGTIHFTLTANSPEDFVNFSLPEIPESIINCSGWTIDYSGDYPTKNIGVNAPENTTVTINAPKSHVTVTGTHYATIIASTNENSLIIPKGVIVDKLIVKKGGVEIHGTVDELGVTPESGAKVIFGACEKLKAEVYEKAQDYIKMGYKGEQNGDGSWNIVVDPTLYIVEEMTETMVIPEGVKHVTLSDELAAVRKAENPYDWFTDEDAHNPFYLDYTIKSLTLPASMNEIEGGMIYNMMALEEIVFDGTGNLNFDYKPSPLPNPIINSYEIKKITIKNLPETCQFYGVNDNSKPNQYFINLDTPHVQKLEIFLPAGWVEKGFQYKFNSCNQSQYVYTYEDGKLLGYCYNAKWYTVTEVNENGVASIIDAGDEKTAIIYAAENTIIPTGVTEIVADEAMQNDPNRNWDLQWPFYQNQSVKSVWFPASLLVKEGKQTFNGTFEHCNNLESITLEGVNDMLVIFPIIARCKGLKSLKIENLPTSFAFQYGPNDNSAVNPRFIYTEGLTDGTTIKVYLPNGWKNSNYQYKFGAQIENGACPTIEVYEADTEGNYKLLGKSVNNVWQDPE